MTDRQPRGDGRQALLERVLSGSGGILDAVAQRPADRTRSPLTSAQRRIWFHSQLMPDSAEYNICIGLGLHGALDRAALESALTELLARHEILRTRFTAPGGEPVQVVEPVAKVEVEFHDLAGRADAEQRAHELARAAAARPFDLSAAPLIRPLLFRVGPDHHLAAFVVQHIVFDGWSSGVFARELSACYNAAVLDRAPELEPLPVQFADHAEREQARRPADDLDYWRQRLEHLPVLELPTDHPRPAQRSGRGAAVAFEIPAAVADDLRRLCSRHDATLFMGLLAAFQMLLFRYSGQADIPVGTLVANRGRAELRNLIGPLVNTVTLRSDLSDDPGYASFLAAVRTTTLEALAHQATPFEQIVEELKPERDASRTPIFQTFFELYQDWAAQWALQGLRSQPWRVEGGTEKFDLTLTVMAAGDDLSAKLSYNTDLFARQTVERMVAHYLNLLRRIVADPARRVSQLDILDPDERRRILAGFNDTAASYPTDRCLHELFQEQAERTPDRVALAQGTERLTYEQLNRAANQLAHALRRRGVGPETVVGVCLTHHPRMLVALLGILKAGGAYLPLDPEHPRDRLAFMLEDTGAPLAVTQRSLRDHLPGTVEVLCLDGDRAGLDGQRSGNPAPSAISGNLVYVIYTSGSTGRPKGVMITHRGLNNYLVWAIEGYGLLEGAQGAPMLGSIAFDLSIPNLFLPLIGGRDVTLLDPDKPLEHLTEVLRQPDNDFSLLKITPSHLDALHALLPREASLQAVRTYVVGADEVKTETVAAWRAVAPDARIIDEYGPTETVVGCSVYHIPDDQDPTRPVPIGVPIANTQMYVLDQHLEPVPVGSVGELYIGGDGVARGYLGRPDLTAEKFLPDPYSPHPGARFYRTGDFARYLPDGNLEFLGRIDNQVKIRAHRIELGEIEARLLMHPDVREAVVAAREDVPGASPGNRQLVAYLTSDRRPPTQAELREHLARALPPYMVPSHYVTLPSIPLSPGGKIDRRLLPAPTQRAQPAYRPPRNPTETRLCELIAALLEIDRVGIDDSFFDLGGHSLLATRLVSRIRDVLGVDLPLRVVFDRPTPAALAEEAARGETASLPPVTPQPRDGDIPLSFAQRRMWLLQELDRNGTEYNTASGLVLDGPLNLDALRATLTAVVARHESLRTTYRAVGNHVVQVVGPPVAVELERTDLKGVPRDRVEGELTQMASDFTETPFDLSAELPLRAHLYELAADRHVLLLVVHHVVYDRPSWTVLLRDFSALYSAISNNQEPSLEPLPIQYADYAIWQQSMLRSEVLEQQLGYWRARLEGLGPLRLRTDRPRPALRSTRGATLPFAIEQDLGDALEELSRRHGATPYMCLLTAFEVLLSQYSGQLDVAVGTPTSDRSRPETEDLIGFFSNTVVLRGDLSGDPSFAELLGRVRETTLGALAHQDLPFERLVEEFKPQRDIGRTPIFQALFVLYEEEQTAWRAGELKIGSYDVTRTVTTYDLTMSLVPLDGRISGGLGYRTDLFEPATIGGMVAQYLALLRQVAADPTVRLSELPTPSLGDTGPDAEELAVQRAARADPPAYKSPRNPTEAALCEVVATVLDLERVGVNDNFFDLGADSMAIIYASRLARDGGLAVQPTDFYEHQDVQSLTGALAGRSGANPYLTAEPDRFTCLVRLKPEGGRRPLYCVHPSGGSVAWYLPLCDAVDADQPVLALQPAGMAADHRPHDTVEQMAAAYIAELRAWQPHGPYAVLGWSLGGTIAYEVARQLDAAGELADPVVLVEPALPADQRQFERDRRQIALFRRGAELLGRRHDTHEEELRGWLEEMGWPMSAVRAGTGQALRAAEAMLVAYRRYERQPYPGAVHLLVSQECANAAPSRSSSVAHDSFRRYLRAWNALATGGVRVHRTGKAHATMFSGGNVEEIGRLVSRLVHGPAARAGENRRPR